MRKTLRPLFWLETSMATITGILFLITLVWRTWIELVFGVDPDKSNGSLEWLIVADRWSLVGGDARAVHLGGVRVAQGPDCRCLSKTGYRVDKYFNDRSMSPQRPAAKLTCQLPPAHAAMR